MDKLRRISIEISQRLSASSLEPVWSPVTSAHLTVLQDFEQVTTDEVAKLYQATAAEIVANGLSTHVPPENHRRRYGTGTC